MFYVQLVLFHKIQENKRATNYSVAALKMEDIWTVLCIVEIWSLTMSIISHSLVVSYQPEQMFELVDDIDSYSEFLPWCEKSTVSYRDEDQVKASLVISSAGISKSFSTHNLLQKHKMIEIRLIDGPFKHLEGFWRFDKTEHNQCKVAFDLEYEFSNKWISFAFGPIFQQISGNLVNAFRNRAVDIYGE